MNEETEAGLGILAAVREMWKKGKSDDLLAARREFKVLPDFKLKTRWKKIKTLK